MTIVSEKLSCHSFWTIVAEPMTQRIPEISGSSIVLLGSFNPAIFQPQWFFRQGLFRQSEAEAAEIKIIVPQLAHFETESLVLQVTPQRFAAVSKASANGAPLRDLVVGTFFILEHVPVSALGINFQMHFSMGSEENWHKIGDRLAPKEGWRGILPGRPGMLSLTIRTTLEDMPNAMFHVRVEPSLLVKQGVFFETNEHYPGEKTDSPVELMGILTERWEEAQIYALRVVNHILGWALETE
jgi:hypothetical protein